jgi:hypothetical protein
MNKNNTCLILLILIIVIFNILNINLSNRDNFNEITKDSFSYWDGNAMPWYSCKGIDNKCSPYCKLRSQRKGNGKIIQNCFPICGNSCINNNDCPEGCSICKKGICSAPY